MITSDERGTDGPEPRRRPPGSQVGIREVARRLDISIGTVSRALNNRYGVNAATRSKILDCARRMGYVPNSAARRLKDRPGLNVGLFFAPFLSSKKEINPVALQLIDILRESIAAEGMALRLIFFTTEAELQAQAEANQVDVAFFYGEFPETSFRTVHELGIPAVVLHHRTDFPDQVSVLVDTRQAGFRAVEYLAALGHERIGLVTGPEIEMHTVGMREGFVEALAEFGLARRDDWIVELAPASTNKDGAARAVSPILRRDDRPSAIVFASDWMALGGVKAARDLGMSLPADLSLVGYDNLPAGAEIEPALTTFDVDLSKLSALLTRLAADLGARRWTPGGAGHRDILLMPDLIKRRSCACLRARA